MMTDAGWDNYRLLTRARTFYVVDTEYTKAADDDPVISARLISVSVLPVVAGKLQKPFYVEMNPTVEVSAITTQKTGFTTSAVARKRPFKFYAQRIIDAFNDLNGVFVAHTNADIRVLNGELERLNTPEDPASVVELPDIPILDTSALPRLLKFPGLSTNSGTISLRNLAGLCHVSYDEDKAHDARYDTAVTGKVLLELLKHAGASGVVDLDELLTEHNRGTTRSPATSGKYSSAGDTHPPVSQAHLGKHGTIVLTHPPGQDPDTWTAMRDLVTECVNIRCQHLTDELASSPFSEDVLDLLIGLLPACTKPGQAGTLLGGVAVVLPDAVASSKLVRWWSANKPSVAAAVRCGEGRSDACPACRTSASCPIDVLYTVVARTAALCGRPTLTKQTVKYKLFSTPGKRDRRIEQWSAHHPELAGCMAAMVIEYERDNRGAVLAGKYMADAATFGLQNVEPRFGLLYAEHLHATGKTTAARTLVDALLAKRTTDEAFDALALWRDRLDQQEAAIQRKQNAVTPTQRPRMIRPRDHINPNPYRVYD